MVLSTCACWIHFLMAASRLDMFWAEATDVDAATESPTKKCKGKLVCVPHELSSIRYVDFTPCIIILVFSVEAMSGSKADIDHAALTYRDFMSTRPSWVGSRGKVPLSELRARGHQVQYSAPKIRVEHHSSVSIDPNNEPLSLIAFWLLTADTDIGSISIAT